MWNYTGTFQEGVEQQQTNSVLRDLGGVFRSTPLTPFALSIEFVDQLSPKELCSKFIPEQDPISSECSLPLGYELWTQGQCRFFDGRSTAYHCLSAPACDFPSRSLTLLAPPSVTY